MNRFGNDMPMIRLDLLTPEELRTYLGRSIQDYADQHVQTGQWDSSHALSQSRDEFEKLLPKGVDTPDQYLRRIVDLVTGSKVGEVWYTLRREGGITRLWIYWIGIEEKFRRQGFASMVLRQLEVEARRLGAGQVALHVFGHNTAAQALYSKLGYETTNVVMAKTIPK